MGYDTCAACFIGHHDRCDGEANIYHVGGYAPEIVPCVCAQCASDPSSTVDVWWDQR